MGSERPDLFADRSLHRSVVDALRSAGWVVHWHDELFGPRTPDHVWIVYCGNAGIIALTKDDLRKDPAAKRAARLAGTQVLILHPSAGLRVHEINDLFATHLENGVAMLRREAGAAFARFSSSTKPTIVWR